MWKTVLATLAIAGMATASTSLAADTDVDPAMSVQALYTMCTAHDTPDQMYCAGFFTASLDGAMVMGAGVETQAYGICSKTTITVGAAEQAFKNWAQKHPEKWGLIRYLGVLWALQETWPCK